MNDGEGALDKYWAFLKENYRHDYSEIAADHIAYPRNAVEIGTHNGFGIAYEQGEDNIAVWINVDADVVKDVAFTCGDCPACTACGSAATELARGKTPESIHSLISQDIITFLGGLPEDKTPCAELALSALKEAANDYLANQE